MSCGSSCVCIGCGGVGLNVIQTSRLSGARNVIAVDIDDKKLSAAKAFGATHLINGRSVGKKLARQIHKLTNGGADYAFEAVGKSVSYNQGTI